MDTLHKILLTGTLATTVITYCIIGTAGTECVVNQCPDNEACFQRNVPNQPSYVCECTKPLYHGYDCSLTANNKVIETCYGDDCVTGSYSSPNYPDGTYSDRERILVLLYIPRATEIRFSFASHFAIERNADELFVGGGLTIPYSTLGQGTIQGTQYFFDGFNAPEPFSLYSDTAFIFFQSDAASSFNGFQIFWNATVADPPPTTRLSTTTETTRPPTATEAVTPTDSAACAAIFQTGYATTVLISFILGFFSKAL